MANVACWFSAYLIWAEPLMLYKLAMCTSLVCFAIVAAAWIVALSF